MNPQDFSKIEEYFSNRGSSHLAAKGFALYVDNVRHGADNNGGGVVARELCESYLTESQMKSYHSVSEKEWEQENKGRSDKFLTFWGAVLSSLVSNVIFALILYILYMYTMIPSNNEVIDQSLGTNGQLEKEERQSRD